MSIADLIERLEGASGLDRDLDWAIWAHVQGVSVNATGEYRGELRWVDLTADYFTRSVDHALALVERVLPGWNHSIVILTPEPCEAYIWPAGKSHQGSNDSIGPTPALALCLALLRALEPRQPSADPAPTGLASSQESGNA